MSITEKDKPEQLRVWKARVKVAKARHKEAVIGWAEKVFQEYAGDNKSNLDTNEKYSRVAQIFMSIEETIQPHLFFQNPKFHAETQRKNTPWQKRETDVEDVVDYEYRDLKETGYGIELENERVILDARLLPFGVTKTTYRVEGSILREPAEMGVGESIASAVTGKKPAPIETPVITKEKGQLTERRNPLNIYLDYTADHITKQKFIVERMVVNRDDLRAERYDQEVIDKIEANTSLIPEPMKESDNKRLEKLNDDPEFMGYEIFEIHDLENRRIHTIASGADDFIEFDTPYDLPEGSQYSFLWFIEKPNEVYPIPPIKYYRNSAYEQSYVYSQVSTQIDKFMPKIGIDKSRLDPDDKLRLKNGNLGAIVGFNGSPDSSWGLIQPTMQKDLVTYLAMMKDLMNAESGVSDYETGNPEQRKATEAAIIARGTRARRFKPQKRVKGFLKNQSRKIWHTMAKNAPLEKFSSILGEERASDWWNDPETGKEAWTDEWLAGDYEFSFDVESISPQDEQSRRETNIASLKTVLDPALNERLLQDKKKLKISPIFEKFVKENLKIENINDVVEEMDVLEPEQEHDLWMQGQFPQINELEMMDQKFLMKHFQSHKQWIDGPAFKTLPPPIMKGALDHLASYVPIIQQATQSQAKPRSEAAPNIKSTEPSPESLTGVSEGSVGVGQGASAI